MTREELKAENTALKETLKNRQEELLEYKQELHQAEEKYNNLLNKFKLPLDTKLYEKWPTSGEAGCLELMAYIEAMAGYYIKNTNIPIDKIVLHTTVDDEGKKIMYWVDSDREKYTSHDKYKIF